MLKDDDAEEVVVSEEVWGRRALARQRQIDIGKARPEYQWYYGSIPPSKRNVHQPSTPDPKARISKRAFDRQLSTWRRRLHDFDSHVDSSSPGGADKENRHMLRFSNANTDLSPGAVSTRADSEEQLSPGLPPTPIAAPSRTCARQLPLASNSGEISQQNRNLQLADLLPPYASGMPLQAGTASQPEQAQTPQQTQSSPTQQQQQQPMQNMAPNMQMMAPGMMMSYQNAMVWTPTSQSPPWFQAQQTHAQHDSCNADGCGATAPSPMQYGGPQDPSLMGAANGAEGVAPDVNKICTAVAAAMAAYGGLRPPTGQLDAATAAAAFAHLAATGCPWPMVDPASAASSFPNAASAEFMPSGQVGQIGAQAVTPSASDAAPSTPPKRTSDVQNSMSPNAKGRYTPPGTPANQGVRDLFEGTPSPQQARWRNFSSGMTPGVTPGVAAGVTPAAYAASDQQPVQQQTFFNAAPTAGNMGSMQCYSSGETPMMPMGMSPGVFPFSRPAPHIVTPGPSMPLSSPMPRHYGHGLTPGPNWGPLFDGSTPGNSSTPGDGSAAPAQDYVAMQLAEWRRSEV